jgi:hypothetical protein
MDEDPVHRMIVTNAAINFATALTCRGVITETTPAEALELAQLAAAAKSLGIRMRDLERILRHAETVTGTDSPAALADLDCDYRVGAVMLASRRWFGGDDLGTFKGRALLYWRKTESDRRQNRQ